MAYTNLTSKDYNGVVFISLDPASPLKSFLWSRQPSSPREVPSTPCSYSLCAPASAPPVAYATTEGQAVALMHQATLSGCLFLDYDARNSTMHEVARCLPYLEQGFVAVGAGVGSYPLQDK